MIKTEQKGYQLLCAFGIGLDVLITCLSQPNPLLERQTSEGR